MKKFFYLFALGILIVSIGIWIRTIRFQKLELRTVDGTDLSLEMIQKIHFHLSPYKTKNLLSLSLDDLAKLIERKTPFGVVKIQKQVPQTLSLLLSPTQSYIPIILDTGELKFLSQKGLFFDKRSPFMSIYPNSPVFRGSLPKQKHIKQKLISAIFSVLREEFLREKVLELRYLSPEGLKLSTKQAVIHMSIVDVDLQISRFKKVIDYLQNQSTKFKKMDFRFKNKAYVHFF